VAAPIKPPPAPDRVRFQPASVSAGPGTPRPAPEKIIVAIAQPKPANVDTKKGPADRTASSAAKAPRRAVNKKSRRSDRDELSGRERFSIDYNHSTTTTTAGSPTMQTPGQNGSSASGTDLPPPTQVTTQTSSNPSTTTTQNTSFHIDASIPLFGPAMPFPVNLKGVRMSLALDAKAVRRDGKGSEPGMKDRIVNTALRH
jgi:hypothetical protein